MENKKYPEPKMPDWLMISGFIAFIILDALSAIPALNWATTFISAAINIAVSFTGIGGIVLVIAYVVGWIIELIPVLSILPILTAVWGLTTVFDRHPELLPEFVRKKIEQAGALAQAAKGKGAAAEKDIVKGMRSSVAEGRQAAQADLAAGRVTVGPGGKVSMAEEREFVLQGVGGGERQQAGPPEEEGGGSGEPPGEEKEDEYAGMTEGQKRIMQELEGNWVGLALKEYLDPEEMLRRVGPLKAANDNNADNEGGQSPANRYNKKVDLRDGQQENKAA